MAELPELTGPEHGPAEGETPDRLIIFLHGLGADGNDLLAMAPVLSQVFPRAKFLAPDAPFPCDMAPTGRQWFSLQELNGPKLLEGLRAVTPLLDEYLDTQMKKYGLTADRVGIIGFSQGTMLGLHVLPRRQDPVAGVLGFSGMVIGPELLAEEGKSKPPVLLVHGDKDEVVPAELSRLAGTALKMAGFEVEVAICGDVPHSIDESGMRLGVDFLRTVFGDKDNGSE